MFAEMRSSNAGTVNDTPEIGFEETPHVGDLHIEDISVNGNAGIVDPGIKAVETIERGVGDLLDFLFMPDVSDDTNDVAAGVGKFIAQLIEGLFAARGKHEASALARGHTGGDKTYAAGCARNDHGLLVDFLEFHGC